LNALSMVNQSGGPKTFPHDVRHGLRATHRLTMVRSTSRSARCPRNVLGCRQVVRQRILIPPFPGSNPGTPAINFKHLTMTQLMQGVHEPRGPPSPNSSRPVAAMTQGLAHSKPRMPTEKNSSVYWPIILLFKSPYWSDTDISAPSTSLMVAPPSWFSKK
jgi:hypothetical protein